MNHLASGSRPRCLAVWLLATGGAALMVVFAAPDVRADGASFDRLLVRAAAAASIGCAVWAWAVTGIVIGQALVGRPRAPVPGVPRWVRAAVLLACGLAVAGGGAAHADDETTARASADHAQVLDGLPPPDRAVGSVLARPVRDAAVARIHVVQPGDTLWDIAATDLGDHPGAVAITHHWHRIHALNRSVIGADPDLIRPGQELRMPSPQQDRREEPS